EVTSLIGSAGAVGAAVVSATSGYSVAGATGFGQVSATASKLSVDCASPNRTTRPAPVRSTTGTVGSVRSNTTRDTAVGSARNCETRTRAICADPTGTEFRLLALKTPSRSTTKRSGFSSRKVE